MPIEIDASDSFANTVKYLQKLSKTDIRNILEKYGPQGVNALAQATPIRTGETALAWYYEVVDTGTGFEIIWKNSHVVHGAKIALLIQYGHGTGTGGYVQGKPYIGRAMAPIFTRLLLDIRRGVTV